MRTDSIAKNTYSLDDGDDDVDVDDVDDDVDG
jgi:hypothetical protein